MWSFQGTWKCLIKSKYSMEYVLNAVVHQYYYSHSQSPAGTACGSEQPGLICSLLWCDTWYLKCVRSTKTLIIWKLTCKYSNSLHVPTDHLHHFPQITAARRSSRGRWATQNSRENRRFVFPQERSAEKVSQSQPSFSEEKLDVNRKGSAGVRNLRGAWLFVFWALE